MISLVMIRHGSIPLSSVFIFSVIVISIPCSEQLQSSQAQTLVRIQRLLNFPSVLSHWNNQTDFCNTELNSSVTIVCYEESITQLHINGNEGSSSLPKNFSIDSFFTTLVGLHSLKVLSLVSLGLWGRLPIKIARFSSLEILDISSNFFHGVLPRELSYVKSIQTLVLDDNMFRGPVPYWLSELPVLAVLSLENNMFTGSLPESLRTMKNLRILVLSKNQLSGEIPDLSSLTNLQVLDLECNSFGPQFPSLGSKLVNIVLRKNKFSSAVPSELNSYYELQRLDISFNKFVGPFPMSVLSLPSIAYLNIASNRFTGMFFPNTSCNEELDFVDLSSNLLTGKLPACLLYGSKNKIVLYSGNCLSVGKQSQHPYSFCRNEALAAGILPLKGKKTSRKTIAVLVLSLVGVVGAIAAVGLILLVLRKSSVEKIRKRLQAKIGQKNATTGHARKLLLDTRCMLATKRLETLALPAYRAFALEELEVATNNFDTSNFMGEGSHGQMYKGKLNDGSFVAIKCIKLKRRHSTHNFMYRVDLISKVRHHHLVSTLGHCFECYLDDSSVSRVFIVFEYVPNRTLRSCICEGLAGQTFTWTQRMAAAIGIAKGVQFLQTGLPQKVSYKLEMAEILLGQGPVAKISSYNLPLLQENLLNVDDQDSSGSKLPSAERKKYDEKTNIYDFGVILLEIIVGRPIMTQEEAEFVKYQLQVGIAAGDVARRCIVDPVISRGCADESLKTVMGICIRCLSKEPTHRPPIEDVLWNLQFGIQVQEEWKGGPRSSGGSPITPLQYSPLPRFQNWCNC
ncbi:hypothetical protein Scep_014396 [Stephania cephalantha]|uniref:Protein kinase domain-containing protein n=1 Tax=Stephania cephalantha TaxID=152367 RepID=A0AAP0J2H5_9MAGN